MANLQYAFMSNFWGEPPFRKIADWNEWVDADQGRAYYLLDWDKIAKYYSAMRFPGIELMFYHPQHIRDYFGSPKAFKEYLEERGVTKVVGAFANASGSTNPDNHAALMKSLEDLTQCVAECGGETINIMPGGQFSDEGPMTDEKLKLVADFINRVGRMTAKYGVRTSPHTEFWCIIGRDELEKFMPLTDPEYVGYCLDTAQLRIGGIDPVDFYDRHHERIGYFHIKDTIYPSCPQPECRSHGVEFADSGKRYFWEMGSGVIDYPRLWGLMKKHNHKGWVTIEADTSPNPLASMLLARWYIDHVLTPIYD